jgi:TetR/AcrR family transcriptional regulator, transcriptional repressor for nem operon
VGSELATLDDRLRSKSEELLGRGLRYLESALAEAQRDGVVNIPDVRSAALLLASTVMGLTLQAKVQNDPEVLRDLEPTVMRLLSATAKP